MIYENINQVVKILRVLAIISNPNRKVTIWSNQWKTNYH